jgi:MFS family permease
MIATDARPERDDLDTTGGSAVAKVVADWRAGLGVVRDDRVLSVLMGAWVINFLADGVFVTLSLSPLVLDVLGGTPEQVGWLGSAQAVGGLTAGMIVVRLGHRMSKRLLLGGGMLGLGLSDLGTANARLVAPAGTPAVGVAMGFMGAAGLPAMMASTGRLTIVQEQVADAYRGRVFGAMGSAVGLALVIGLAAGGLLGDHFGIVAMLSFAASLRAAGGLLVFVVMPRTEVTAEPAQVEAGALPEAEPAVPVE